MSFDLLLQNGTLVLPWGEVQADIGVRAGHIVAIGKNHCFLPFPADST